MSKYERSELGKEPWDLVVIGGGAAGFFAAITAAEQADSALRVLVLEKSSKVLGKVRISGGGRCNVTHACFDPKDFVENYPRGKKSLIGPFHRWGASETVDWFESRGVPLKSEADGRMFPTTDRSQSVIDCLVQAAREAGVVVKTRAAAQSVRTLEGNAEGDLDPNAQDGCRFEILSEIDGGQAQLRTRSLLLATGGIRSAAGEDFAKSLGHTVAPPVPSLFTFHVEGDRRIEGLQGISVSDANVTVPSHRLAARGALLVTHWGLSGPAILRLSAWGARKLHSDDYRFDLVIDWLPETDVAAELNTHRTGSAKRKISARSPFGEIPRRLWERLVEAAEIPDDTTWAQLSQARARALEGVLSSCQIGVEGKSLNKEEFVTCGGVCLREVDFRTMESRASPGLYFAGEILDIDGITGGFNFQNAWTTGHIAGSAIAEATSL